MELLIVPVDVPEMGDHRLKSWAKIITNVDESLSTGWAFDGEFVAVGGIQDLEVGSVLMVYGEKGSRTNPHPVVGVFRINSDSTLSQEVNATGKAWARTVRDKTAELLMTEFTPMKMEWSPELMRYSEAALSEELERRRGLPT